MHKIAATYIRVSDERQDEYSPDSQLKKNRECAAKDGYEIPDEYVFYDDGISGRKSNNRGDFKRMIGMAKEKDHPFERIYVWKFSRFARNQEESLVYKNLLQKNGVSVVSTSQVIPEGPFGSLIERIIEWMDEFYSINLGQEVQRGLAEKISRGEPIVAPPFGYYMEDKKYLINEDQAPIIREIFERYANGEKQRAIAMDLASRGVKTIYGNTPETRWVDYIVRNPCYIGKLRYSREGAQAVSKRDYDNENIVVVDGHHEPIIDTQLWDRVQAMLEEQRIKYPKHSRMTQPIDYMLKGLVRCSACGSTLAMCGYSGKNKTRYLQCCNYNHGKCSTSHAVNVPIIEEAFTEAMKDIVKSKSFTIIPKKAKKDSAVVDYDKLIAAEERRMERAKQAYLAEIDTIEQYAQNKKEISERIEDLKSKAAGMPQQVDINAYAEKAMEIVEFIQREDVSPAAKNEALRTIIEKVVYEKANKNLAIYFHGN